MKMSGDILLANGNCHYRQVTAVVYSTNTKPLSSETISLGILQLETKNSEKLMWEHYTSSCTYFCGFDTFPNKRQVFFYMNNW
jgi:hypothetical protein